VTSGQSRLRVCFVLNDLNLSGGVGVVLEHAHHLAESHGMEVSLALSRRRDEKWSYRRLEGIDVMTVEEIRERSFDVAVATWWETVYALSQIKAERYAYFVQSMEDRFYEEGAPERLLAAVTHSLPLSFITEARWIAETLEELRPDAPCFYVRNGVAKDVFQSPEAVEASIDGPLRILVEGSPDVWFKGVRDAFEAVGGMTASQTTTFVSLVPVALDFPVDRVRGPMTQDELAALYAETDVVLKLSKVEGMFGPPLEAFHMGATCVVTPVTGHEEYVVHGWNGIVTDWDSPVGTARWLDLLARDRRLLHYLRSNALRTARGWPSWQQASQFMASALTMIRRAPAPRPTHGVGQLLADVDAGVAEFRKQRDTLQSELGRINGELTRVTGEFEHRVGELWTQKNELSRENAALNEALGREASATARANQALANLEHTRVVRLGKAYWRAKDSLLRRGNADT
jgi:glycosyltransferase involved in cell wall biosynthesis